MAKKKNTFWLPYPGLLIKLGFEDKGQNTWKRRIEGRPIQIVSWYKLEGQTWLTLAETWSPVFAGELQSQEEFLTLLRQVRWPLEA